MTKPMEGVRVLDFTDIWAGPWVARIMSDLGAHVIKVEGPRQVPGQPVGLLRQASIIDLEKDDRGRPRYSRNAYQTMCNPGKDHVALYLKKEEAVDLFKRLVQISDVVVENYAPRVMENLGLGYKSLCDVKPDIIMLCVSAMGQTGPERDYTGLGFTAELLSGMDTVTGYENCEPHKSGINYGDPIAGVHGALAVTAALLRRVETGQGMLLDLSLRESLSMVLGEFLVGYSMTQTQPPRKGNRHTRMAPHNIYRCLGDDKWVTISVGDDGEFAALCQAVGQPALAEDPRFANETSRKANERELDPQLEEWCGQRTHYEAMHQLQAAGVAAGAVLNTEEVVNDPHMVQAGAFQWVEHPNGKTYPLPQLPWDIPTAPRPDLTAAAAFGAHNRDVWGDLVGLNADALDALMESEVVLT